MRRVVLEPPNSDWKLTVQRETALVSEILGNNLIENHHIGSTSIPGIVAKPVIDLMPVVRSLDEVDRVRAAWELRGYMYRGEYGMVGRRYIVGLMPDGENHSVHIHILPEGHGEIARHLVFRDYLRANEAAAREYEVLKLELKDRFEFDRQKYQDGKAEFCERLLQKAMGAEYIPPAPWS